MSELSNATGGASQPMLEVRGLSVIYSIEGRQVQALNDALLEVYPGEGVGIVGESGSGKSTFARALMALLPSVNAEVVSGTMRLHEGSYSLADTHAVAKLRGHGVAMVFQDPLSYLNPLMSVGAQIVEAIRLNDPGRAVDSRVRQLLELVRLPVRCLRAYPHELSGGMRQRALIAIALGCRPKLLIADEPTTALDVTTQAEILALLHDLMRELRMSLVLISHDLGVVANLCQRVYVMYAGRTIESGPRERILTRPLHPYTQALLHAARALRSNDGKFVTLSGEYQSAVSTADGCGFMTRCRYAMADRCGAQPALEVVDSEGCADHRVRCFLHTSAEPSSRVAAVTTDTL